MVGAFSSHGGARRTRRHVLFLSGGHGTWSCRLSSPGFLGSLHNRFRFLGWNSALGNPYLGHTLSVPRKVQDVHIQNRRGHDGLRGSHGGTFPHNPPRKTMELPVAHTISEFKGAVDKLQVPACVGRVRGGYLSYGEFGVFRGRNDSRYSGDKGQGKGSSEKDHILDSLLRMEGFKQGMASLHEGVSLLRGSRHAACSFGSQRRVLGLRDGQRSRMAHNHIPSVLRCGSYFLGTRDGYHPYHTDKEDFPSRGLHNA